MADLPPNTTDATPTEHSEDGKREALISAARDLFLKNTYANISIRKIADKAKVNSAMIAYYFGSKSGLFREMVRSYLLSNVDKLKANIGHPDQESLEGVFLNFYRSVPSELALLIFRIIFVERGEMRDWLLENLMPTILGTADSYFTEMIRQGGRDVDPAIIRTIFQCTLVMPVMIYPTLSESIPDKIPDDFFNQLAKVNAAMITQFINLEKL
jgi:AcrR family transcriptional regulator